MPLFFSLLQKGVVQDFCEFRCKAQSENRPRENDRCRREQLSHYNKFKQQGNKPPAHRLKLGWRWKSC
jgi:hypothetical protein